MRLPNREALKAVSTMDVDNNFIKQYANIILSHSGEQTEDIEAIKTDLSKSIKSFKSTLDIIEKSIFQDVKQEPKKG